MAVLSAVAGAVLVLLLLVDVFEAIVLPRRVTHPYRLARLFYRAAWRGWREAADRVPAGRARAALLSGFGPLSLLALIIVWAGGLILGFGLLHHALGSDGRSFGENVYLSGTTFTTLGYGD